MAFATMTITSAGIVKWSATLSNGQAASGSAQLFDKTGDIAYVALFKATKKYAFSSLLKIRGNGSSAWNDQLENQIVHNAADTAALEVVEGGESIRSAFGGWWTPNAAPADLLAAFGYSDELTLESEAFDSREVLATARGFTLEAAARGDRLSYAKKTGTFSGAVSIPVPGGKTIKAMLKGVLLPGWYSCGCEEPGEGEDELVTRPFGAGTIYYKVRNGRVTTTLSAPVYLKAKDAVK
jgi:hypothetical protein